jgi:hypothetical protein
VNADHAAARAETPPTDNIVSLTDTICDKNQSSAGELEQKRKIAQRVNEIIVQRLERDALHLEESAIVGDHTIAKRHQLMDLARCLRTTVTWIAGPAEPTHP